LSAVGNHRYAHGFRAKSIKTRIETADTNYRELQPERVLEQNPSKQGLKLWEVRSEKWEMGVLEQNPSKQGLKLSGFGSAIGKLLSVLEQNPSKQGLKHIVVFPDTSIPVCFRAKSIKTRIETLFLLSFFHLSLQF